MEKSGVREVVEIEDSEVEIIEVKSKRMKVSKDDEGSSRSNKRKEIAAALADDHHHHHRVFMERINLPSGIYKNSRATLSTFNNIANRRRRRGPRPGTLRFYHDNTSPGYGWLLPGWIAEERIMDHGRVYRYYYDPRGRMYYAQDEVLGAWADSGLIVLDL